MGNYIKAKGFGQNLNGEIRCNYSGIFNQGRKALRHKKTKNVKIETHFNCECDTGGASDINDTKGQQAMKTEYKAIGKSRNCGKLEITGA